MYQVFNTADEVSHFAAKRILDCVAASPDMALGLATGSTQESLYAQLVRLIRQRSIDVSKLTTFNLDEYIGLGEWHRQSYRYYMHEHLFKHLPLSRQRLHVPDGLADNPEKACQAYSEAIRAAGGLDFQLLGIGSNGHIGFNEPYTPFSSRTHTVALSDQTRLDNGRFFSAHSEVPTHAMTLGIQDILEAREIMLLATGRHKADTMAQLYHGDANEALPASALKHHHNVTIVMDREAASRLPEHMQYANPRAR